MLPIKFKKYFYIALAVYVIASIYSTGFLYPDEYGQILLFALQKIHLMVIPRLASESKVPWEYYAKIRPSLLPWVAFSVYKIYQFIMPVVNPYGVTKILKLSAAILTLYSAYLVVKVFLNEIKLEINQKWFILISLFSYVVCVTGVHFTSENISAKFFIIAFCWYFLPSMNKSFFKYLLIGFLMGFSFFSRFQIGFMIAGFGLWLLFIDKIRFKYLSLIILGFILAVFINVGLDYIYYGDFVFTPWRYFISNIIQHQAARYGVSHWYSYFLTESTFLPYGPFYVLCTLFFCYKRSKHVITWTIIPFIAVHIIISHKEPRFLIPILPFMAFILIDTLQIIQQKYPLKLSKLAKVHTVIWRMNLVGLLISSFLPQTLELYTNHFISDNYKTPTMVYYLTQDKILDFYQPFYIERDKADNVTSINCKIKQRCLLNVTCEENQQYKEELAKYTKAYSSCIDYNNQNKPKWLNKLMHNIFNKLIGLGVLYDLNKPNQSRV